MEEEEDGEKQGKRSDSRRKTCEQSSTLAEFGANGSTGSSVNKEASEKIRAPACVSQLPVFQPAEATHPHCPGSQSASAVTALAFPHLLHFTAEEIAAAPGIEAETFPEMGFIESRPESHSSLISPSASPRCSKSDQELKESQTAAVSPQQLMAHCYSGFCNGPLKGSVKSDQRLSHSQRKMRQVSPHSSNHSLTAVSAERTPRAMTRATEVTDPRWGTSANVVSFLSISLQFSLVAIVGFFIKSTVIVFLGLWVTAHQISLRWSPGCVSPKAQVTSLQRADAPPRGSPCPLSSP